MSPTLAGELFPTEPPEHREPPPGQLKSGPCGVFAFPLHKATPHRSPRHLLKTEIGLYSSFAFPAQEQNLEIFPVTCPAQGAAPGHSSDCPALSLALTRLQGAGKALPGSFSDASEGLPALRACGHSSAWCFTASMLLLPLCPCEIAH